jgi:predicted PurR-regulated permease PerM
MEAKTLDVVAALIIVFLTLAACRLAQPVLEPVVFAIFVVALVWPFQAALQRRAPRAVALLVTVAGTLAVLVTLSSLIVWSGGEIADWLRRNLDRVRAVIDASTQWLEAHDILVASLVTEHFDARWLFAAAQAAAARVNIFAGFALVVLIYVIMGLAETAGLQKKIAAARNAETARRLLLAFRRIGEKFRRYMLVRTFASLVTGALVFVFALGVGLELAAAWGVLTFALNYLPYFGPLVVTLLPALFAYVQFNSIETALLVLGGLSVIQLVIGSGVEPALSGTALAMSPSLVVFSVLLWTFLWGLPGAFIGVPIAIAVLTLCEHFPSTSGLAALLSGDARPSPNEPLG